MKSILISIKPKWVTKILNGEKTIEIRKTMPKCDLPIDVYIYCTKEDNLCCIKKISRDRYICGKDFDIKDFPQLSSGYDGNGKVVAKFTLNKVEEIIPFIVRETKLGLAYELTEEKIINCQKAQLTYDEYNRYLKCRTGYAWHISNLKIFDKPKELSEFYRVCNKCPFKNSQVCFDHCGEDICKLTKAPQSFCYVEAE